MHAGLRTVALLFAALSSATSVPAFDKITQTPSLIQEGFGPGGLDLTGDGSSYCGPTSVTMSLGYLAAQGFTQLLPDNPSTADYLQLEQNIVGLSGATQMSGSTGTQLERAVKTFLAMKGISGALFVIENSPEVAWFTQYEPDQYTSTFLAIGWYSLSHGVFSRNGGHFIGVTATNLSGLGTPAADYLVLSNPAPASLFDVPDVPQSNPQFAHTLSFSGSIAGGGFEPKIQFDYHQTNTTLSETSRAIIESGYAIRIDESNLPANGWTPATWTIDADMQDINTGGGDLTVLAPIAGTHGIIKSGIGTLYLTGGSNVSSGTNQLFNGGISSNQSSGSPLGTGDTYLGGSGTLTFAPAVEGSPADITLTLASGSGSGLHGMGGATLALDPNGNTSLTVTVGDAGRAKSENLTTGTNGTLVIAAATGNASLGSTVQVLIAGGGSLPHTNGMLTPGLVARDNNAAGDGDYLADYGATGLGIAAYSLSSTLAINNATDTTVYNAVTDQTVNADTTAHVYALRAQDSTIGSGGGTTTLQVGDANHGGVILNGGRISTTHLDFGESEALIYTSNAGGTIDSAIHTTRGVTTFGPGNLTFSGSSSYDAPTTVQSGTLTVTGYLNSGTVTVGAGANLAVSGSTAHVASHVVIESGTLLLQGGSIETIYTGSYSTLIGHGTIQGPATINGTIGAGPEIGRLVFEGESIFEGNAVFEWTLASLTSDPAEAGTAWNMLDFRTSGDVNLGTSDVPFSIVPNFSLVDDPNSGHEFWNIQHQWKFITSENAFNEINFYWGFAQFTQGYFQWDNNEANTEITLYYTPVPEPGTVALAIVGGLALTVFRRRK
jgi:autotransporter-associated beta strand protein